MALKLRNSVRLDLTSVNTFKKQLKTFLCAIFYLLLFHPVSSAPKPQILSYQPKLQPLVPSYQSPSLSLRAPRLLAFSLQPSLQSYSLRLHLSLLATSLRFQSAPRPAMWCGCVCVCVSLRAGSLQPARPQLPSATESHLPESQSAAPANVVQPVLPEP